MNRRLLTILVISFAVAGMCSFLVYRLVGNRVTSTHKASTTRIVAAAADIKLGTVLSAVNLTTIEVAGTLPKGAVIKPESILGRGVISDLYQGEPILESRLASAGSGGGLAATIRKGMRACAVKVDEVVGVAGFVTPGMRVDVLISGNPPGAANAGEGPQVKTLLQNIEVLSAGTDIQKDAEGKPKQVQVVNLLVTPEQAEILSLASSQTHIQLVLRNPLDTQIAEMPGTGMSRLFGGAKTVTAPANIVAVLRRTRKPAPQIVSVEVINGAKRTDQKFESHEAKQ
ncbi:MAG: Flp pilus assembly protein CpaB [Terracidiphilus sp.]|nr:Flp pilus assembly protein CpaB [Terracidiphilus sp.]